MGKDVNVIYLYTWTCFSVFLFITNSSHIVRREVSVVCIFSTVAILPTAHMYRGMEVPFIYRCSIIFVLFSLFFFFFTNSLHIQFLSDRNQAGMGICGVSTMLCLFQACFPSPSCGGSLLYGQYSVNEETRTFFLRTFDNNLEHVKTEDVGWKRKISDKRLACAEDDRKIMLCILRQ